jgi:hypothetical protein
MSRSLTPQQALLLCGCLAIAVLAIGAHPAAARTFVRFGVGVPVYAPVYYPPPGVVYAYPPPVAYAPPVLTYGAPPIYAPPPPTPQLSYVPPAYPLSAQQECREYRTTTAIGTQLQEVIGTACRQADGSWRIVR